jgi:antitoxin (DNA-binding transcriptional repressor) of toxin-antitoxin stability system
MGARNRMKRIGVVPKVNAAVARALSNRELSRSVGEAPASFKENAASMAEARENLSAIVIRASQGEEIVLKRWQKELYRIGPLTILTAVERSRARELPINEIRQKLPTICSRMTQLLEPVLITRSGEPVAALWCATSVTASASQLAVVNEFRAQMDSAFETHIRILTSSVVQAMSRLLRTVLPDAIRDVTSEAVATVIHEKLGKKKDDMADEITEAIIEHMATSDSFAELIRVLAASLERDADR